MTITDSLALAAAVASALAALATITSNAVIVAQLLRVHRKQDSLAHRQGEIADKQDAVLTTVNGRMGELLHEARKSAALEALVSSDAPVIE